MRMLRKVAVLTAKGDLCLSLSRAVAGVSRFDPAAMRKPYKGETEAFDIDQLVAREPFAQFTAWFEKACETDGIVEANAMSLATSSKEGRPSCRIVLMKGYDKKGFSFYTNYESRKGQELEMNPYAAIVFYWTNAVSNQATWSRQAENPYASLVFFWEPLVRSVRIEGRVERLSEDDSIKYFTSRPKASQIGACISKQSSVIEGRQVLTKQHEELNQKYADQDIPKPSNWGGYIVKPDVFEFWQGQTTRLHDRIRFRRPSPSEVLDPALTHQGDEGWVFERLSP